VKKLSLAIISILAILDLLLLRKILFVGYNFQILNPKGIIAFQEKNLLITALSIMLIIIVPVFIFMIFVARRYRESNIKAAYAPDWDHNTALQLWLWAFPIIIICALCVLNWVTAHQLDPHDAIASDKKPLTIEVIALRWKWLFIYPDQGIATVNYIAVPNDTPITFMLTGSDTPMNSFWVPQLGGQIYAMSGMVTQTHLMATSYGIFQGRNAEINGAGYSDMTFSVKSVEQNDFNNWVNTIKQSSHPLNTETFNELARPSQDNPVTYYSSTQSDLFTTIVTKYMAPGHTSMSGM
jgi:cytochrome o ubiquinol oxidase subunit II